MRDKDIDELDHHDCANCKLKQFLEEFGYKDLDEDNCFVLCTKENKSMVDALFGYYLENLFTNQFGAILYTGLVKDQKGKLRS